MFKNRYAAPDPAPATRAAVTLPFQTAKPAIRLIEYDIKAVPEKEIFSVADLMAFAADGRIRWLNIKGLGENYGLHPLSLKDALHTGQTIFINRKKWL